MYYLKSVLLLSVIVFFGEVYSSSYILPHDIRCHEILRTLSINNIRKIQFKSSSPRFHVFNLDQIITKLQKAKGSKYFHLIDKLVKGKSYQLLCIDEFVTCFVLLKKTNVKSLNSSILTFKDVYGRRFEVIGKPDQGGNGFLLNGNSIKKVIVKSKIISAKHISELRSLFEKRGFDKMNVERLTNHLTRNQLTTSENEKIARANGNSKFSENIKSANKILVELLLSGESLKQKSVERINWLVNQGISNNDLAHAGIYRGSKNRYGLINEEVLNIDFSMSQSWQFDRATGLRQNNFSPASEVYKRMDDLLTRVNKVNNKSQLEDIFSYYHEYILIHPFADGNGRSGRMLLNFMLLKGGYPPLDVPPSSLYFTNDELVQKYYEQIITRN